MRDAAPPYGVEPPDDRYPADHVLADLRMAVNGRAVARILARYAALRHWLLRLEDAPAGLTGHAAAAARAHLAALAADGIAREEEALLSRLIDASLPEACGLLAAAATEALRAGDSAGAAALSQAARDAMLVRLGRVRRPRGRRPPPPS